MNRGVDGGDRRRIIGTGRPAGNRDELDCLIQLYFLHKRKSGQTFDNIDNLHGLLFHADREFIFDRGADRIIATINVSNCHILRLDIFYEHPEHVLIQFIT